MRPPSGFQKTEGCSVERFESCIGLPQRNCFSPRLEAISTSKASLYDSPGLCFSAKNAVSRAAVSNCCRAYPRIPAIAAAPASAMSAPRVETAMPARCAARQRDPAQPGDAQSFALLLFCSFAFSSALCSILRGLSTPVGNPRNHSPPRPHAPTYTGHLPLQCR